MSTSTLKGGTKSDAPAEVRARESQVLGASVQLAEATLAETAKRLEELQAMFKSIAMLSTASAGDSAISALARAGQEIAAYEFSVLDDVATQLRADMESAGVEVMRDE